MFRFSFVSVLSLLVVSAGQAQERQPLIINGLPTDAFPAVGIVGETSVGGFCTGTLISPTHVLTAAHCAEAILDLGAEDTGTFEVAGRVYRTAQVEILSTYDNRLYTNDVAILVLAEAVTDVTPMVLSPRAPEVGETVTIVGYGGQGTPELGSDGSFGEKLIGTVTVDSVTEFEFSWLYDDPTESNPAPGDSGGPVFIETGDGSLLAGLVSSGTAADAELGDTSFNMRVDAYEPWITETVLATMNAVVDDTQEEPSTNEEPAIEEAVTEEPITEEPDVEQPTSETPAAEEPVTIVDVAANACPDAAVAQGESSGPASVDSSAGFDDDKSEANNKGNANRRRHHARGEGRRPGNNFYGNRLYSGSRPRPRSTTRGANVRRR